MNIPKIAGSTLKALQVGWEVERMEKKEETLKFFKDEGWEVNTDRKIIE